MSRAFLIFPNQLFKAVTSLPKDTVFYFIEDRQFFYRFKFHTHRLVLYRAGMQSLRERLLTKGYEVRYFDALQHPTWESLGAALAKEGFDEVHYYDVADHQLTQGLQKMARQFAFNLLCQASPAFLTTDEWLIANPKALHSFPQFLKAFRAQLALPAKLPTKKAPSEPLELEHDRYIEDAIHYVKVVFPHNPGRPEEFALPVTHNDALELLEYGVYLMPMLNAGLLTPHQVLVALKQGMPQAETILSAVLAWREYQRARYQQEKGGRVEKKGPASSKNQAPLLVADALHTYPDQGFAWYMATCLDAYDWYLTPQL